MQYSSPMACLCATNLFLVSFGILLWTGKAAGFCASVFETQQGECRLQFLCLPFLRKAVEKHSKAVL